MGRMARRATWPTSGIAKLAKEVKSESVRLADLRSILSAVMTVFEAEARIGVGQKLASLLLDGRRRKSLRPAYTELRGGPEFAALARFLAFALSTIRLTIVVEMAPARVFESGKRDKRP